MLSIKADSTSLVDSDSDQCRWARERDLTATKPERGSYQRAQRRQEKHAQVLLIEVSLSINFLLKKI